MTKRIVDWLVACQINDFDPFTLDASVHPFFIRHLSLHADHIQPGDAFIALPGSVRHGSEFIEQAIHQGALLVLIDHPSPITPVTYRHHQDRLIPIIHIPQLRRLIGHWASIFYDHPSHQLKVVGVTGTNGKTSVTHFLAQLLEHLGYACQIIGTLGVGRCFETLKSTLNTTPDVVTLQRELAQCVQKNIQFVAMEVSSHALIQYRVLGIKFYTTVLTNITHDHLDFHKTFRSYIASKLMLFQSDQTHVILNIQDPESMHAIHYIKWKNLCVVDAGLPQAQDVSIHDHQNHTEMTWKKNQLKGPWGFHLIEQICDIHRLNQLMAMAVLDTLIQHVKWSDVFLILPDLKPPQGRCMEVKCLWTGIADIQEQEKNHHFVVLPKVIVDYAHTPEGIRVILSILRRNYPDRSITCIFGCGGNRDRSKRSLMGEMACSLADHVVLTQDNSRFEDPHTIIEDILKGCDLSKTIVIMDRSQAIYDVIMKTDSTGVVAILGKGHEAYQIVGDCIEPFSDYEKALEVMYEKIRD